MPNRPRPERQHVAPAETTAHFRSAAVARMVRMPVATLRIWERRYGVVSPDTSPSGHRLYTAQQVQRLAVLKQLTDLGHAIGEIAHLDLEGLRAVAATHASALARSHGQGNRSPWRVVVVDAAGAARWPALLLRLPRGAEVLRLETDLDALAATRRRRGEPGCDALIVSLPHLLPGDVERLGRAARACGAARVGVHHGFAARELVQRMGADGIALLREPADDAMVLSWLQALSQPPEGVPTDGATDLALLPALAAASPAERRYDDATLAAFAQLSSTIACECPRHVAELLMQLSHFESYSAQCAHRSRDDAALHRYLQQVAASARGLFETALERVAQHEGLMPAGRPR